MSTLKPMEWEKLLCTDRLGKKGESRPEPHRSPFQRDYDRVIFSSAFRRMQDKTQVFPLAESDYVRTRLTHSLETSCVGRSLGFNIGSRLAEKHRWETIHPSDIGAVVAAAALAHDIGNPPFGHSGEDAFRHWFHHSDVARRVQEGLSKEEAADFARYEGNAQGFRIITRLQMPDNEGGLQLTCATLGAFAKYPVPSSLSEALRGKVAGTKKFSYFHSEATFFAEVAEKTGLIPLEGGGWVRHPLALLVEAADDICYHFVDFEDGVRLGLIPAEEAMDWFQQVLATAGKDYSRGLAAIQREKEKIEFLRANAIGTVLDQVSEVFMQCEGEIMTGAFHRALVDCSPAAEVLKKIIERSRETIYSSERGLEIEAAGFEVIGGLLDLFVTAVEEKAAPAGKPSARSRTVLKLIPEPFIGLGRQPAATAYQRLLGIADFVSGMTDSYAVGLYRKLRGISFPGQR